MKPKAESIDQYLDAQPEPERRVLEKLRKTIKEIVPEAEEIISYGMPAFRYHGVLVGFAAAKDHFGFYPFNSSTVAQFKDELKGYSLSKGTIRFPKYKPLPDALIKKIVKARVQENLSHKK
jgi:uncharacterized protein YdhG (YjbR/CyaY superfamily)